MGSGAAEPCRVLQCFQAGRAPAITHSRADISTPPQELLSSPGAAQPGGVESCPTCPHLPCHCLSPWPLPALLASWQWEGPSPGRPKANYICRQWREARPSCYIPCSAERAKPADCSTGQDPGCDLAIHLISPSVQTRTWAAGRW